MTTIPSFFGLKRWSVRVVFARHDLFTQLFAYVKLVPLNHDEPLVLRTKRAYPLLVGRTLRRLHGVPQH